MTAYTTNYLIPYPTSTDSPCAIADTICLAAGVVEDAMALIEASVERVYVKASWRVSMLPAHVSIPNYTNVPFAAVDFDTSGTIDLSADPYTVKITEPGLWCSGFWGSTLGISTGALSTAAISTGSSSAGRDYASTPGWAGFCGFNTSNENVGDEVDMSVRHSTTPANISVNTKMWAFWMGDLS